MMKHGKHVLCEKPITSHARELEEMERVARENNVMLMEAMKSVYCPGYEAVRTNLHKLGPVRNVTLNFLQYTPCYEAYQKGMATNQFNPALSNCALVDTGVYTIHMLLALFGKPKKFQANAIMLSNGMDAAGTISCVYDDFLATLIYSKLATYEGNQIQGEQAAMIIDKISDIKHITIKYRDDREDEIIPIKKHPVMYYEIGVFLEAIKKGEQGDLLKISKLQMAFLDEARTQLGIVFPADNK
ncbi:MAG: Gfo/Idh/MocA family oxidoreductase [Turicibacter sp.]|nr:Gfo/Idh/MocA family oxidoreductase [Turicibacter sp.]